MIAGHFASLPQQAHAARLGMWVFLASELLLFAGLFALFASYRAHYPAVFHTAVHENTKALGSINTGVLLISSALVAGGVHALREGRSTKSSILVTGTILLGVTFLAIKAVEYTLHFDHGLYPGRAPAGSAPFWTLYYAMTGLHALHVTVGVSLLSVLLFGIRRGFVNQEMSHRLELGAIYWHLIDVIWIFLWPLFYLA
jgi:cytochrome c oxidase subunit 3